MMSGEKINIHSFDKDRLRKLVLSRRDTLTKEQRARAAEAVAARISALPELKEAQLIMSYMSFRSELSTVPLHRELLRAGKKLCFPLCEKDGLMQAWFPMDENAWKKGMMGIMEPDSDRSELIAPEDIDLVLCPMVAFDRDKHRMGYGGGYYDRYLPKCKKALRIGIAFEAQCLDALPVDNYDQAMDIIITEENIY